MNNEQRVAILEKIISLSKQMLELCQQQQWDEMVALEHQRKSLIAMVFPIDENDQTETVRDLLEMVLELNQQIEMASRKARDEVQSQLNGMSKQRKATAAYKSS